MNLPNIDHARLSRFLPVGVAIDALEHAFREALPEAPLRSRVETGDGDLLLMPSAGVEGTGVKLVTVNPSNPDRGLPLVQGIYVLFAPGTLEPVAVIDGAALTAVRTSAVSGLATRHLAVPEASRLVIFGAGTQGAAHLGAMAAVRPIEEVTIVSRTEARAEALAERARGMGLRASVGDPDAVADAQIVCTCTTSARPLFDGSLLRPGTHVNAVGAYTPETREVDGEMVRRARVIVETREAALAEAGDLLIPIREGVIGEDDIVADLSEVVAGSAGRTSDRDVTLFKSVGLASEDLVVARAALDRIAES